MTVAYKLAPRMLVPDQDSNACVRKLPSSFERAAKKKKITSHFIFGLKKKKNSPLNRRCFTNFSDLFRLCKQMETCKNLKPGDEVYCVPPFLYINKPNL